jgi:hypothetical protein
MFEVDKTQIGEYIANRISESSYKSDRQFGIAYLKERYGSVNDADIPNIQNRICQIKKGNKWIQLEDLPYFSKLLNVSIEDIISAGNSSNPVSDRLTNYSIAHSTNPDEWEAYINHPDKLILNPDEYNKTVIDYALEFGNYTFLKYLMDKKYIWFVSDDKAQYHEAFFTYDAGFGAGTSIKRREIGYTDPLETRMLSMDDLRYKMISLSLKNKDFDMLERLHAREIPLLYNLSDSYLVLRDKITLPDSKNVKQFISLLADCSNTTLKYFFEPFTITGAHIDNENTFIFPYIGSLIDTMIKRKNKNISLFIEKAIKYNSDVIKTFNQIMNIAKERCSKFYNPRNSGIDEDIIKRESLRYYYFYPNTGFVSYSAPIMSKKDSHIFLTTNVIRITAKSSDPELQFLIDELNSTYQYFVDLLEENKALFK